MPTGNLVPARLPSSSVALSVRDTTVCASTRETASTRRTAAASARFDIFHQESSRLTDQRRNPTPVSLKCDHRAYSQEIACPLDARLDILEIAPLSVRIR